MTLMTNSVGIRMYKIDNSLYNSILQPYRTTKLSRMSFVIKAIG